MKAILIAVLALVLELGTSVAAEPSMMLLHETPNPVPSIAFTDENGNAQTLEAWRGKVLLLNIWATWCGPCRAEMPTLDRLQATLGGEDFEVLALSIDRAGDSVVRKFFDEIGIEHLDIFVDKTMKVSRDLKIFGLPGTVLIGPNGQELGRLIGPAEWDAPEMIAFFENIIAKHTGKEKNHDD